MDYVLEPLPPFLSTGLRAFYLIFDFFPCVLVNYKHILFIKLLIYDVCKESNGFRINLCLSLSLSLSDMPVTEQPVVNI